MVVSMYNGSMKNKKFDYESFMAYIRSKQPKVKKVSKHTKRLVYKP